MNRTDFSTFFDLEYFFELSPDLICIAGYDGYFKKINPAVLKTLGYTNEELKSRPINSFVHPDDQEITAKSRQSVLEDQPLLNFENRYLTKSGEVVWLSWTSMPIKRDQLIFGIAKKIDRPEKAEEVRSNILDSFYRIVNERLKAEDAWLDEFEAAVKKYIGNINLSVALISAELAISERQLFRRVKHILGITPNQLIRNVRLKVASEAIASGKYKNLHQVATIAGFRTPSYFNKLYKEVYNLNATDLIAAKPDGVLPVRAYFSGLSIENDKYQNA